MHQSQIPQDFSARERVHQRRWESVQRIGNRVLGFMYGAGLVAFLWILEKFIVIGGCPYVSL